MITYVDTSALVKLVVDEDGSERTAEIWDLADSLVSSSFVVVEARAALAAAARGGRLSSRQHADAKAALSDLVDQLDLVEVTPELLSQAADLAEAEALRGYDAVHLAAALLVGADVVASSDHDLLAAASGHGIHVADPTAG